MIKDLRLEHTAIVKEEARKAGFDYCGITAAGVLQNEATRLQAWLAGGHHGKMEYMARNFDKRLDPSKLVEGARSVISLLFNYYPENRLPEDNNFKISKYAYGTDYHFVIKKKLRELLFSLRERIGRIQGRAFVDSAPVMERQLASKSGLGWIGKNTMLINRQQGSYLFIAELITDLELMEDGPIGDFCGNCTRCIDACPTNALSPYQMDASKCISYLTIELKDNIPDEFSGKIKDWIFGCDICQDVCPWNRFSRPHQQKDFLPPEELFEFDKKKWQEITRDVFLSLFRKSPLKRPGFEGFKRNINFASQLKPSFPAHENEHDDNGDQHQDQ